MHVNFCLVDFYDTRMPLLSCSTVVMHDKRGLQWFYSNQKKHKRLISRCDIHRLIDNNGFKTKLRNVFLVMRASLYIIQLKVMTNIFFGRMSSKWYKMPQISRQTKMGVPTQYFILHICLRILWSMVIVSIFLIQLSSTILQYIRILTLWTNLLEIARNIYDSCSSLTYQDEEFLTKTQYVLKTWAARQTRNAISEGKSMLTLLLKFHHDYCRKISQQSLQQYKRQWHMSIPSISVSRHDIYHSLTYVITYNTFSVNVMETQFPRQHNAFGHTM